LLELRAWSHQEAHTKLLQAIARRPHL